MLPYAYYLLKVIACSGILFGYYWLVLRNKSFHAWNRFYLLASVLLSLLLPFIKISFEPASGQGTLVQVLRSVSSGDEYMENVIIHSSYPAWHIAQLYPFLYAAVSGILLAVLLHGLFQVLRLIQKFPSQKVERISLINTDAKGTPFSFLNYIFWNSNIDIDSVTGSQVFKHEVAHVQEKHTHDKLFINSVLVFFWCNPFFWLMRKELNMIHEFIADKKAIEDNDTSAFAAMILQATYPQHRFQLSNNFFYSPIKRRLAMLTRKNNPKINYISRLAALALTLVVFAAFTIKTTGRPTISLTNAEIPGTSTTEELTATVNDTMPLRVPLETDPAKEYARKGTINELSPVKEEQKIQISNDALYVVDGKIIGIGKKGMDQLNQVMTPEDILELRVLKGETAIKKYGAVGGNGVLEFTSKPQSTLKITPGAPLEEVVVTGYQKPAIQNITITSTAPVEVRPANEYKYKIAQTGNINVASQPKEALKEVTVTAIQGVRITPANTNTNGLKEVAIKGANVQEVRISPTTDNELKEVAITAYGTARKLPEVQIAPVPATLTLQPGDDKVFSKVEIEAAFPGGKDAWKAFLVQNIKGSMPVEEGWKAGTYQVIVQFIVYSNGSVGDVKTLNYKGSKTAEHCISIVKNGPKWLPALQNGKKVNAFRKQPITFVVEATK